MCGDCVSIIIKCGVHIILLRGGGQVNPSSDYQNNMDKFSNQRQNHEIPNTHMDTPDRVVSHAFSKVKIILTLSYDSFCLVTSLYFSNESIANS